MSSTKKNSFAIPFAKMEGCGNDYVFIDSREQSFSNRLFLEEPFSKEEIRNISDRNVGIGSDGLVLLAPPKIEKGAKVKAEVCMYMWNADGSPSDMCGNALRCTALWEYQRKGQMDFIIQSPKALHSVCIQRRDTKQDIASLKTGGEIEMEAEVEVEMPAPLFAAKEIPFAVEQVKQMDGDQPICALLDRGMGNFSPQKIYTLSMGNPHCVLFLEESLALEKFPVQRLGKIIESHPSFPERCNVEFVVQKKEGLFIRTYERGSGETLACGSGACAAHSVAVLRKGAPPRQKVFLRGGELEIEWEGNAEKKQSIFMRGPARLVYKGTFFRSNFQ